MINWPGARIRWVPANLGLAVLFNFEQGLMAIVIGPVALFIGRNP